MYCGQSETALRKFVCVCVLPEEQKAFGKGPCVCFVHLRLHACLHIPRKKKKAFGSSYLFHLQTFIVSQDNNFVCDRPRLPVGVFRINYSGTLTKGTMRIVLYDGIVYGTLATSDGLFLGMLVSVRVSELVIC